MVDAQYVEFVSRACSHGCLQLDIVGDCGSLVDVGQLQLDTSYRADMLSLR